MSSIGLCWKLFLEALLKRCGEGEGKIESVVRAFDARSSSHWSVMIRSRPMI